MSTSESAWKCGSTPTIDIEPKFFPKNPPTGLAQAFAAQTLAISSKLSSTKKEPGIARLPVLYGKNFYSFYILSSQSPRKAGTHALKNGSRYPEYGKNR